MSRMNHHLHRCLFLAAAALAALGIAGAVFAQGAPMTPVTTPSASPSSVSTYTASVTATATVAGGQPTPNAPATGSGAAASRPYDVWLLGAGIAAMIVVAVAGGWVALNGLSRPER